MNSLEFCDAKDVVVGEKLISLCNFDEIADRLSKISLSSMGCQCTDSLVVGKVVLKWKCCFVRNDITESAHRM